MSRRPGFPPDDQIMAVIDTFFRRPDGSMMGLEEIESVFLTMVGLEIGGKTLRCRRDHRTGRMQFWFEARI